MEPYVLPTLWSGVDHLGIVGTVAPGTFAQPGRCWRFVSENPSGQGGALLGACRLERAVPVRHRLEARVVVREARRGSGGGQEDRGVRTASVRGKFSSVCDLRCDPWDRAHVRHTPGTVRSLWSPNIWGRLQDLERAAVGGSPYENGRIVD
jgi:hypothetical protein